MSLPLAGVRVVEVANYVAVPAAGALLADLGADVVKIETPPRGEIYRRSRPRYAGYACDFDENPPFPGKPVPRLKVVRRDRNSKASAVRP